MLIDKKWIKETEDLKKEIETKKQKLSLIDDTDKNQNKREKLEDEIREIRYKLEVEYQPKWEATKRKENN